MKLDKLELPTTMRRLGDALQESCPHNDCIVYLNVYAQVLELEAFLSENNPLPESVELALVRHLNSLFADLEYLYFRNFAIGEYRRTMKGC